MELERKEILPEPTETEVRDWLLSTLRHSVLMEFCLGELQIGVRDPQRPHDIVGAGNKFEWDVLRGFAVQYRPTSSFEHHVFPSLMIHRQQHHHRQWNDENSGATGEEMMLGATDAVCSLLDNRIYQGGIHTFEEIQTVIERNPFYRRRWMSDALEQVRQLHMPDPRQILSFDRIPNLGLAPSTHEAIVTRVRETLAMLSQEYGYRRISYPQ